MFNEKKSSIKGFLAAKLLFLFDSSKKKTKKVCFLMKNQKIRTKIPWKIPHAGIIVYFYNKACTGKYSPPTVDTNRLNQQLRRLGSKPCHSLLDKRPICILKMLRHEWRTDTCLPLWSNTFEAIENITNHLLIQSTT